MNKPIIEWFTGGRGKRAAYLNGYNVGEIWLDHYTYTYHFYCLGMHNDRRFDSLKIAEEHFEDLILTWWKGIKLEEDTSVVFLPYTLPPQLVYNSILSQITKIESECFPPGIAYPEPKLEACFNAAPGRVFVAKKRDEVAGYFWSERWDWPEHLCLEEVFDNAEHTPKGTILYIANIAVSPKYRGQGIGKKMVEYMLQEMRTDRSIEMALLAVSEKNQPAMKIYQSLGFKFRSTLPGHYTPDNLPEEDAVVMVLFRSDLAI